MAPDLTSTNDDNAYVQASSLAATYAGGVEALTQIQLCVPRGQFVSIVGPSGCGKSTLLRLVAGLLEPSTGELQVAGQRAGAARRSAARVSFVFQDPTLLPWRSVADNIQLPLELQKVPRERRPGLIDAAIELVGLADFRRKYPAQLSGGMRMRVSLARALVTEPDLLLLDEPFAALDDLTRGRLNEELRRMWAKRGWTAIFVTHNITEAVLLSERVLVMTPRPGRIAADLPISLPSERAAEMRADPTFARLVGETQAALRRASE